MERKFPFKLTLQEKNGLITHVFVEKGSSIPDSEAYKLDFSALTPFQCAVYNALLDLGVGETITYGELARRIGRPKAARAIGTACRRNPWPIIVPCHRVVASNHIGGFAYGLSLKRKLLSMEGVFE